MSFYRYELMRSGSRRIGRGITLSWSGNRIRISARLEVSGAAATQEIANQMEESIERIWTASFDGGYSVSCAVDMLFRTTGSGEPNRSQIYVTVDSSATAVNALPTLYYAYMNYHTHSALDWVPAHEFGHMLGLEDHYDESIISRIGDLFGAARATAIQRGWEGNIMAVDRGVLERRNLEGLQAMHMTRMVTIAEDYYYGLDRSIRQLYHNAYSLPFMP